MYTSRYQDAIYWSDPVPNGLGGWIFANPRTIKVRWEEHVEQVLDAEGNDFTSTAQVYTLEKLKLGGYLKLVTVTDIDPPGPDPTSVSGARAIVKIDSIPDLRALRQNDCAFL